MPPISRSLAARAFVLAAVFATAASLYAQKPPPAPAPVRSGMTVHGHWIIEVKSPDGKIVTRREFENTLLNSAVPAGLFSGQIVPGGWFIQLFDPNAAGASFATPCGTSGIACLGVFLPNVLSLYTTSFLSVTKTAGDTACDSSIASPLLSGCSGTLTVAFGRPAGVSTGVGVVLNGTVQSNQTINIGAVTTNLFYCGTAAQNNQTAGPAAISPAACSNPGTGQVINVGLVTGTNIPNPINNVETNQIVSVTVYLTFQ